MSYSSRFQFFLNNKEFILSELMFEKTISIFFTNLLIFLFYSTELHDKFPCLDNFLENCPERNALCPC